MSEKKSLAMIKRWSMIPKEERSKMSSHAATVKWSRISKKERSAHARMMINKRYNKKNAN